MTDRQDIDALLIGSLYGELSSTEEARLAAHLESHPQDRTALADLTWARDAVRESRILQVQLEPPQSISALLLQEAHRRAPKAQAQSDGERSWFQRFMRSFMLHPAMAAAAMLVLIIGVAGTLYMKKGDHFAKQTADEPSVAEQAPALAPSTPATTATDEALKQNAQGSAAGSATATADNFAVKLDESDRDRQPAKPVADPPADKNKGADLGFAAEGKLAKEAKPREERSVATTKPAAKKPASKSYIEVTTPDQAPKDFEAPKTTASRSGAGAKLEDSTTVAGGAARPSAPSAPGTVAPQPPPPAAAETEKQEAKPDPMLAWATKQHAAVVAQVKAGKCDAAATLALQIASRAPAYYTANVEDDIALKKCKAYIAQQREQEAERVQRAKATQRRADEPAKAAPATK